MDMDMDGNMVAGADADGSMLMWSVMPLQDDDTFSYSSTGGDNRFGFPATKDADGDDADDDDKENSADDDTPMPSMDPRMTTKPVQDDDYQTTTKT